MYSEYAKLINKYNNTKRPSAFARYYNINKYNSIIDKTIESTYDKFNINGIVYDLYDYTPLFYTSPVVNDSVDAPDLVGKLFQGPLTITTYTIKEPNINDLLIFPYNPTKGDEIFHVTNIRAVISGMNHSDSDTKVNWFELTLEYAPLEDVNKLDIANNYVYLLSEQTNVLMDKYVLLVKYVNKIQELMNELQDEFIDNVELYKTNNFISVEQNQIFYDLLAKTNVDYHRYFETAKLPFGVTSPRFDSLSYVTPPGAAIADSSTLSIPSVYSVDNILDYEYPIDIYNMNNLLTMFFDYISSIIGIEGVI